MLFKPLSPEQWKTSNLRMLISRLKYESMNYRIIQLPKKSVPSMQPSPQKLTKLSHILTLVRISSMLLFLVLSTVAFLVIRLPLSLVSLVLERLSSLSPSLRTSLTPILQEVSSISILSQLLLSLFLTSVVLTLTEFSLPMW